MNNKEKYCTFFGHRNTVLTPEQQNSLYMLIENLILNKNVTNFVFGSKSNFDDICYKQVSILKKKYTNIKCIAYVCKHEWACLYNKVELQKNITKSITGLDIDYKAFDKIEECFNKIHNGKNAYIYRNQLMIDKCDYIIIYYNNSYTIHTNSGTKLALNYAKRKHKQIIYI